MRSRADGRTTLEWGGTLIALAAIVGLLWQSLRPETPVAAPVRQVDARGRLDSLQPPRGDSVRVRLAAAPSARTRALLAAWQGAGVSVRLEAPMMLSPVAVGVRTRHPLVGGSLVDVVAPTGAVIADAGGPLDSIVVEGTLLRRDVPDLVEARGAMALASAAPASVSWPQRVLVAGGASWEARFITAALEEAGWQVDATFRVAPTVAVQQGGTVLSGARHAAVVLLADADAAVLGRVPAFVRAGGGAVLVGEAVRAGALASVRAGVPGDDLAGEAGAEASDEPRHGLDAVRITSLAPGGVALETRDGAMVVAARRVGAGRVVQVGYENSWLWRMAGDASAPGAHRAWWSALVASVIMAEARPVALRAPWAETADAAPVAALAASLGLPAVRPAATLSSAVRPARPGALPAWAWLVVALLGGCGAWFLRRWQGLP